MASTERPLSPHIQVYRPQVSSVLSILHRMTGIALAGATGLASRVACSRVTFRPLQPGEALAYWNTGEPRDKAGGYGIQGLAAVFVSHLEGSYSGVVGLPLCETAQLLREAGVPFWHQEG